MSLRLRLLNLALRALVRPRLRRATEPAAARREFETFARYLMAPPRGARLAQDPVTGGLRADPPEARGAGVILYFHGGGYVAGSPRTHRGLLARLAAATGLPVHAPVYRLAPEDRLPAALEDARRAWDALSREVPAERIILMGDSAGGGIALALLAGLCGEGTPPGAAACFSAFADLTGSGPSHRENRHADPLLPAGRLADLRGFIVGQVPPEDPRLSPLFAAFPGCPPLLLIASRSEILRDDSVLLARRLQSEGAPVTLRLWDATPHAWPVFGKLPETGEALQEVARFLRTLSLSGPPQGDS